jgi:hypothetical protein
MQALKSAKLQCYSIWCCSSPAGSNGEGPAGGDGAAAARSLGEVSHGALFCCSGIPASLLMYLWASCAAKERVLQPVF